MSRHTVCDFVIAKRPLSDQAAIMDLEARIMSVRYSACQDFRTAECAFDTIETIALSRIYNLVNILQNLALRFLEGIADNQPLPVFLTAFGRAHRLRIENLCTSLIGQKWQDLDRDKTSVFKTPEETQSILCSAFTVLAVFQ